MNPHKKFGMDTQAVSPVVATLLLVLVAAGAAIGFGVFLNGFQKNTQEKVSSHAPESTLRIGGSSTVFDFSNAAKTAFETANPTIKVDLQKGGSGAGLTAVCLGNLDLGSSSDDPTLLTAWSTCPDLNGDGKKDVGVDPTLIKIAYDAIAIVVPAQASGCSFNSTAIQELYYHNVYNGVASSALINATSSTAATAYTWTDLVSAGYCSSVGTLSGAIQLVERKDNSGTEGDFCALVFSKNATMCNSGTLQLNAQPGSPLTTLLQGNGNDGVGSIIGNKDTSNPCTVCMGFMDAGGAMNPSKSYASGIALTKFSKTTLSLGETPKASSTGGVDSSWKTPVQNCIAGQTASATNHVAFACRTLYYIVIGTPQGITQQYLDFVTQTQNNIDFAAVGYFVPLY